MSKFPLKKGTTSKILAIFVQDSSAATGVGLAGLTEASGIVGGYTREGSTGVALAVDENVTTEGTYQAPSAAGKVRIGTPANMRAGDYELHIHNDLLAAGADSIIISLGGASNMAELRLEIQLINLVLTEDLSDDADIALAVRDKALAGSAAGSIGQALLDTLEDTNTTLPALIAALNNITAANVLAAGDVDGFSLEEILKLLAAPVLGKASGMAGTSPIFRAADDSKDRVSATVDEFGNRTAVTLDAAD